MFTDFVRIGCPALIAAGCLVGIPTGQASAQTLTVLRVNDDANPGGNGGTWGTAFKELDDAIAAASGASSSNEFEIWVASGVYRPDPDLAAPHLRNQSFTLRNFVAILGGFAGNETAKNNRNPLVNISRLSGDLANNDNPNDTTTYLDNSYHVVTGTLLNDKASIDGFTISDGDNITLNAGQGETVPPPAPNPAGLTEPQSGAGMLLLGGQNQQPPNVIKPGVTRIIFEKNRAKFGGGLLICGPQQSNPYIANCTFRFNYAKLEGGGFSNIGANAVSMAPAPRLINAVFHDNHAEGTLVVPGKGGAIYNAANGTVNIVNGTITQNTAGNGGFGGLFIDYACDEFGKFGQFNIQNSILWANDNNEIEGAVTLSHSIVQDAVPAICETDGYIMANPAFVNAVIDDFRLQKTSPAVDAALNNIFNSQQYHDLYDMDQDGLYNDTPPDRLGGPRLLDGAAGGDCDLACDMGAFERIADPCLADLSGPNGVPDNTVNVIDLLYVIGQWCSSTCPSSTANIAPQPCPAEFNNIVNVEDLLQLISMWGGNCTTGQLEDIGYTIEDAYDCMDAASLVHTPYTEAWYNTVDKCISAIQNQ